MIPSPRGRIGSGLLCPARAAFLMTRGEQHLLSALLSHNERGFPRVAHLRLGARRVCNGACGRDEGFPAVLAARGRLCLGGGIAFAHFTSQCIAYGVL